MAHVFLYPRSIILILYFSLSTSHSLLLIKPTLRLRRSSCSKSQIIRMRTLLSVISIFCSILSVYVASGILVHTATGLYETENSVTAVVKPSSATKSNLPKQKFILKTHVHSGQNLTKNGLYVDTYHTGEKKSSRPERKDLLDGIC